MHRSSAWNDGLPLLVMNIARERTESHERLSAPTKAPGSSMPATGYVRTLSVKGCKLRIAVTGHINLTPSTVPLVEQGIRDAVASYVGAELVGVSCIAAGADQIFAKVVLELGGKLEVILPSSNYRERKVTPDNLATFDDILSRATTVRHKPFPEPDKNAYKAANAALLTSADRLVAVWDGRPSDGAGTADVVEHARSRGLPVDVVWPDGAERSA